MHFVKTANLKNGMRLAKCLFDKKGAIVFDRDYKLDDRLMDFIKTNGIIGIFVLDPTEPLPPQTEDDVELERTKFLKARDLGEEIKEIVATHRLHKLDRIADDIIERFGTNPRMRLDFSPDARSKDNFVYKHLFSTGILATLMLTKMGVSNEEKKDTVMACLLHDIGKANVPDFLLEGETPQEQIRILDNSQDMGFELLDTLFPDKPEIRKICAQSYRVLTNHKFKREQDKEKVRLGARVLSVADTFETMTAMSITGEMEPNSQIYTVNHMLSYPDVFNKKAVEVLIDSVTVLKPGMSVLLNNGFKAFVTSVNPATPLYPVVVEYSTNQMLDLGNRSLYYNLEIVDTIKKLDNRYSMI